MKRRLLTRLVLALAILLAVLWVLTPALPEPTFQDRTMSQWITHFAIAKGYNPDELRRIAREIGQPAFPYAVKALHKRESFVTAAYLKLREKLPDAVSRHLPMPMDQGRFRGAAAEWLSQLGPQAVPELVATLKDDSAWVRATAVGSLGRMGREAVPALPNLLALSNDWVRAHVAVALIQIAPRDPEVIRVLNQALTDQDQEVRWDTAFHLINCRREIEKAVPIMVEFLKVNDNHSTPAAMLLGMLGQEAKAAVPALLDAKNSNNTQLSEAAGEALEKINQGEGPNATEEDSIEPK